MASNAKRKTTMAKLNRERRLRERRQEKQARKEARRQAPEDGPGTSGGAPAVAGAADVGQQPAEDNAAET